MKIIDTHTHIYDEKFDEDRDEVIDRAINQGVEKLLLPNIDSSTIPLMKEVVAKHPTVCFPMMGLHPTSVNETFKQELDTIKTELYNNKENYIAVGEIGIDLYWDKTFVEEQKYVFAEQIKWAKELGLPIAIHARDSFDEIFEVLDIHDDEKLRGVFHCFSGTEKEIEKILGYHNFYFGIGGVFTFKKSHLPSIIHHIPQEKLIVETDSPYLAPTPKRGKRNESSYTYFIVEKLAESLNLTLNEVAALTTKNATTLFKL